MKAEGGTASTVMQCNLSQYKDTESDRESVILYQEDNSLVFGLL